MMSYWKTIIPGPSPPDLVYAIIECPKKTQNKYEMSKTTNLIKLDRVLHSSVMYPQDYGFIPGTYAPDGDALDILVLITNPTHPGIIITTRPIGVLIMEDEKGVDEKILGIALNDPIYNDYFELEDIPKHALDEIQEFFRTYKNLEEPKYASVKTWENRATALDIIERSIKDFNGKYGDVANLIP